MEAEKMKIWDPDREEEDDAVEVMVFVELASHRFLAAEECERWCEKYGNDYLIDGVKGWTLRVRYADGTTDDFSIEVEAIPSYSACRVPLGVKP